MSIPSMQAECNIPAATVLIYKHMYVVKRLPKTNRPKASNKKNLKENACHTNKSTLTPSKLLISLGVYSLHKWIFKYDSVR